MPLLLGLDIGTSAAKGVLLDAHAERIVAESSVEYPLSQPRPGWSEQDPEDWWLAVCRIARQLLAASGAKAGDVTGIGLSGQMHGAVFIGADAHVSGGRANALRPAILWNDQRTARQCEQIEHAVGGRSVLVELVGNAAMTGFTLPKVLWLREQEPDRFARARHLLLPKDFVRFRLTGELATDVSDAAGTLALDVDSRTHWSNRVLGALSIDAALFPTVLESCAVAGLLTEWAAAQTGLEVGTPVVAGAGDNQAGAVGAGVVASGEVLAALGTSGVIFAHTDKPRRDLPPSTAAPGAPGSAPVGRLHTMCAATGTARAPGGWSLTGCMLSAGGSLRWARSVLAPGVPYDELVHEAAAAPPGSEGLVFLPYLTGERCPHPDPNARGAWVGLTSRHTRGHMVRAVLEGVSFGMTQMLDLMRKAGVAVNSARLGGGGSKSALWRQILADNFGVPCKLVGSGGDEGPALGAAIMAGVGAGTFESAAAACAAVIPIVSETHPHPAASAAYTRARATYDHLYHDLRATFTELASQ
ncbi:MAG: xylulokinase [Phycisphaeraceae bacterium]|nr:xylulokinase [Phycisphaeraceae bacterium]